MWNNCRSSSSDDNDESLSSTAKTTNGKTKQVRYDKKLLKLFSISFGMKKVHTQGINFNNHLQIFPKF